MRAQDEHLASRAGPGSIRTEREFMDALRALRVRSGLSYRDVAARVSQAAPRHAMAKSTLAVLFAQDALPRRPRQLTAIVDVLAAELGEPAGVPAGYLAAWTRLMTARLAQPGPPAGPPQAPPPPPPLYPAAAVAPPPAAAPRRARSDFEKAGGLWPLLAGGTVLSLITWLPFAHGPVPFWVIWLAWCGPVVILAAVAAGLSGQPHGSRSSKLPAEYVRYEQRGSSPRPRVH